MDITFDKTGTVIIKLDDGSFIQDRSVQTIIAMQQYIKQHEIAKQLESIEKLLNTSIFSKSIQGG